MGRKDLLEKFSQIGFVVVVFVVVAVLVVVVCAALVVVGGGVVVVVAVVFVVGGGGGRQMSRTEDFRIFGLAHKVFYQVSCSAQSPSMNLFCLSSGQADKAIIL
jgi:hypothetical protein